MTTAVNKTPTLVPAGTWVVDPSHSRVEFQVKHLGIASVRGNFDSFDGTLVVDEGLDSAEAYGTVDVASLSTNEDGRDDHLRSPDFFDAGRYPQITFTSTAIDPVDDETFEVTGQLTLHGVTREVTLMAEVTGTEQDPWGNDRVGLEVTGQIDRSDYGMAFNQALGSGNVLVSDTVRLNIDISAIRRV
jgi:polyisoprenoid-binding protein YceI